MGREVWGTYSVRDHCDPRAFVADVMLYDRIVIPIPSDNAERKRWEGNGWNPARQDKLVRILDDRAYCIKWDIDHIERWRSRYEAGKAADKEGSSWQYRATAAELIQDLPPDVTGVAAIPCYRAMESLENELRIKEVKVPVKPDPGVVTAVLGQGFLVPDEPRLKDDQLLKEALGISSDSSYRRKRSSFWRWQREFLKDCEIMSPEAIRDAVEEMHDLLEDEQAIVRKAKIRMSVSYSFLVGSVTLGLLSAPLTPITLGIAFLSVGQFVAERLLQDNRPSAAALFYDFRKHFGMQ